MDYDLILHVDEDSQPVLNLALTNAANYQNALKAENFCLCLVANGPAVQLFTRDKADLMDRAKSLHQAGLRIKLCANALKTHKILEEDRWDFVEIVTAGLVEIVELQRRGFAYIKP